MMDLNQVLSEMDERGWLPVVIGCVVNRQGDLSREGQSALRRMLKQKGLVGGGFRDPLAAPQHILRSALEKAVLRSLSVRGLLLQAWIELNGNLIDALDETAKSGRDNQSADEHLRLVADQLRAEYPEIQLAEVSLALAWKSLYRKKQDTEAEGDEPCKCIAAEDGSPSEASEGNVEGKESGEIAPMEQEPRARCQDLLAELEAIPVEELDQEQWILYAEELKRVIAAKTTKLAGIQRQRQALTDVLLRLQEYSGVLSGLHLGIDCWSARNCPVSRVEHARRVLEELLRDLAAYQHAWTGRSSSFMEEKERIAHLSRLMDEIAEKHSDLGELLTVRTRPPESTGIGEAVDGNAENSGEPPIESAVVVQDNVVRPIMAPSTDLVEMMGQGPSMAVSFPSAGSPGSVEDVSVDWAECPRIEIAAGTSYEFKAGVLDVETDSDEDTSTHEDTEVVRSDDRQLTTDPPGATEGGLADELPVSSADSASTGHKQEPARTETTPVVTGAVMASPQSPASLLDADVSSDTETCLVSQLPEPGQSYLDGTDLSSSRGPARTDESQQVWKYAGTAREMAMIAQDAPQEERPYVLRDLVWRLMFEDKMALAFQVARCLSSLYPDIQPQLQPWLTRAAVVGLRVRYSVGELSRLLTADFAQYSDDTIDPVHGDWGRAAMLLLASAALRPALLAPATGASAVLHSLRINGELYEYCHAVADYGDQLQPLDPTSLKKLKDQAAWEAEVAQLLQDVEEWWNQELLAPKVFGRATQVWRKWQETGGIIHTLLLPVRANDPRRLVEANAGADRWSDDGAIKKEVDRTDREMKRLAGRRIEAKALSKLVEHVGEAVGFVRRWIDLQESRPRQSQGFVQRQAEKVQQEVRSRQDNVLQELRSIGQHSASVIIRLAATKCADSVEDLRRLFDPDVPLPVGEPPARFLLNADLLRVPDLRLDDDWEPKETGGEALVADLLTLVQRNPDWATAFKLRSDSRDHEATYRILEYLRHNPTDKGDIDVEQLSLQRRKLVYECLEALNSDAADARVQLETAVAFGLLGEEQRIGLAARIDGVDAAIAKIRTALESTEDPAQEGMRFGDKHAILAQVRQEIESKRKEEIERVRRRLDGISLMSDSADYQRIKDVLEKGDILTANEYVDMASQGLSITEAGKSRDAFLDYFPRASRSIDEYVEVEARNNPRAIIRLVEERGKFCGMNLNQLPSAQTDQAAEMLRAWFSAKKRMSLDSRDVTKILTALGFNVTGTRTATFARRPWVSVTTKPIRDRERCPVPAYGSSAKGQYRVLGVWEKNEEDLLEDVGETAHGDSPVIVLHFGRMSERKRRNLARLCRERRRTFVVIDDTLMLYLCGERGSRLPVMYECTLPMALVEPFTTTAGLVPPEMFYGRRRERDSIIDPMGSCFIYGGRQLGKTALLHQVERDFHDPEKGRIAIFVDLKTEGIGLDRSIDELWSLLTRALKEHSVVPAAATSQVGPDKLFQHIRAWLNQDEGRRILILLDEADHFLDRDGEPGKGDGETHEGFIRSARLKGWMDRTDRRFKAVLAGLHNVQRTTRLANHPLAHYGEPICIGPLLDNGEWREARALVERPLSAIGYRFESPDLVTRILSQTNYYPSLIQLYCEQLLRHANNPNVATFDWRHSPPYLITSRSIEDAYRSQELRKEIRRRFMLTLDLDRRYRVIAFSIAYDSLLSEDSEEEGISVYTLRDLAVSYWPAGFRGATSEDSFRSLLDEMVGLGVLRVTGPDRFALRSPNVVSFIGTKDQIEDELLSCSDWEPPLEYEPSTMRNPLVQSDKTVDLARRNPLTAQQLSELRTSRNGVSVIFGCEAAGLGDLEPFLEAAFGEGSYYTLATKGYKASFIRGLQDLSRDAREGTTLVLVPASSPWSEDWIDDAVRVLSKAKSRQSFLRVVFIADPETTWQLVTSNAGTLETLHSNGVSTLSLGPWHDAALRQWLEDLSIGSASRLMRERIRTVTGNWPLILRDLFQRLKADPSRFEQSLLDLSQSLCGGEGDMARQLVVSFGLGGGSERATVLRTIAELGESIEDELVAFSDGLPVDTVRRALIWADLLGLVVPTGGDGWRIDSVAQRILASTKV